MAEFAPPGLEPDIPVSAGLVAAAREGVRTAISAAQRTLAGAAFTYAVCRPPGHHAGPAFLGGYCYLNNAAAAVQTLLDGGLAPVGILDLDLHYPNGTAALLERLPERRAATAPLAARGAGHQRPRRHRLPRLAGERALAFEGVPDPDAYVAEVATSIARWPPRRRRWSSRSATTPCAATRTAAGPSSRRSSPGSAPCWRRPGGRSASSRRAATRSTRSPTAPRLRRGLLGAEGTAMSGPDAGLAPFREPPRR